MHRISLGPFQLSSTDARVAGQPPLAEWAGPLHFAIWCQRASPWWIGDLLNSGDAQFGEAFSQICQGVVSAEMLQRYESVARRVPPENRRATLSWSAHAAVARLAPAQQREWLQRAEEHGWSSDQLRIQVRRHLQEKNRSNPPESA